MVLADLFLIRKDCLQGRLDKMNKNKSMTLFFQKISKVFSVLGIVENKEEVIKNLVASFLLNFTRLLASDEKIAPLLNDYFQATDSDPTKLFEFLDSKNVEYQALFNSAQKETLQSFVFELKPSLTPEKTEALNKVISV